MNLPLKARDQECLQRAWRAFQSQQLAACQAELQLLSAAAAQSPEAITFQALVLIRTGQPAEAEQLLRSLIARGVADAATYVNLGELLRTVNRLDEARAYLQHAVEMAPRMAQAHYNLGTVLSQQGDDPAAIANYQTALSLQPNYGRARFNLANSLRREGRLYPARDHLRQLVGEQPQWAEAWQNLGAIHSELGETNEALDAFRRAGELSPKIAEDCRSSVAGVLITMDSVDEAAALLRQGSRSPWDRLKADLLCSAVPESTAEIDEVRARASAALEQAVEELAVPCAGETVSDWFEPPMQWAYHGCDERPLKELFAKLYLSRVAPLALPRRTGRAHAGFVLTHGHEGVFARCLGKILRSLATDDLRVSIICTRAAANTLRYFSPPLGPLILETPSELEAAARFLAEQQLDLLYYWECGTDAFNYLLPFWKPAAVQCTSWGWPVTSGNPRMDAFLTRRVIEPADAQRQFTERLIWLDGPLTNYPRPAQLAPRQRSRFGFSDGDRVYFCQQNLRKWHPDFDGLLRGVLDGDSHAIVACIGHTQSTITDKLLARLQRSGIDTDRRIRVFPFMERAEYLELLRVADLALDTPHYGGGMNTLADAFAVGTPLLTLEGATHRSRVAAATLREAGAGELVADSTLAYVESAHYVAHDSDRRAALSQRLSDAYPEVFENTMATTALRDVLLGLIHEARQEPRTQ